MNSGAGQGQGLDLSVVSPLFNEEGNVEPLVDQLEAVLDQMHLNYEIILIDDGSSDSTWSRIEAVAQRDERVRGLCLSRNFGHQNAVFAGLNAASGRTIVSMDGDLQHPPGTIPELYAAWLDGAEIVETQRRDSADTSAFKRITSRWFYRVFSLLSGIPMSPGSSDFRLMDARAAAIVCEMRDSDLFLRGITHWIGFRRAVVPYQAAARHTGSTKYSLTRMIRFASSSLVSFSAIPLRLGIWIGLATSGLAFVELVYILVAYASGRTVAGWASIVGVVSLMFGVLFILVGIIGAYLASIFEGLKNRPRFIVRDRTVGPK
jgi:glycosyltransferase involved in cell wall biosynthesis